MENRKVFKTRTDDHVFLTRIVGAETCAMFLSAIFEQGQKQRPLTDEEKQKAFGEGSRVWWENFTRYEERGLKKRVQPPDQSE